MNTSALIFDMDGTLVDSMPAHAQSWEVFANQHGIQMPVAEILRRTTGRNGAECIRELFGSDVHDARAWELIGQKEAIYRDLFTRSFACVAGAQDFIARARQAGLRIAIASGGDRHNIAFNLSGLKLPAPPEVVVGGDEGLPGKPEPVLFLEAARRLGMLPAECIVFEDAPFGIEAARRAGMRAVAICTTHTAKELDGPHVLAHAPHFSALMNSKFLESLTHA